MNRRDFLKRLAALSLVPVALTDILSDMLSDIPPDIVEPDVDFENAEVLVSFGSSESDAFVVFDNDGFTINWDLTDLPAARTKAFDPKAIYWWEDPDRAKF